MTTIAIGIEADPYFQFYVEALTSKRGYVLPCGTAYEAERLKVNVRYVKDQVLYSYPKDHLLYTIMSFIRLAIEHNKDRFKDSLNFPFLLRISYIKPRSKGSEVYAKAKAAKAKFIAKYSPLMEDDSGPLVTKKSLQQSNHKSP